MLNIDTNPVTETIVTNPQHNADASHMLSTNTTSPTNNPPISSSSSNATAEAEAENIADALHMLGPYSPILPVRPRNQRPPRANPHVNVYEDFGTPVWYKLIIYSAYADHSL